MLVTTRAVPRRPPVVAANGTCVHAPVAARRCHWLPPMASARRCSGPRPSRRLCYAPPSVAPHAVVVAADAAATPHPVLVPASLLPTPPVVVACAAPRTPVLGAHAAPPHVSCRCSSRCLRCATHSSAGRLRRAAPLQLPQYASRCQSEAPASSSPASTYSMSTGRMCCRCRYDSAPVLSFRTM